MAMEQMAAKGRQKLARKAGSMASNYESSKSRAISNYGAVGFGPQKVAAYTEGVQAATYRAPDPTKWETNWKAAMRL